MIPVPPVPFPRIHVHVLRKGTRLERIHSSAYSATSFNPGVGRPTRFAPLLPHGGPPIPHAYAASTFECASHETVFHEIQFDAPVKTIAASELDGLVRSRIRCLRTLRLASLFEPDLNRWRLRRSQLIDTFASAYGDTARWALAIHASSGADGLIWTSKRCDPRVAVLLFGDRVVSSDLQAIDTRPLEGRLRTQLEGFAERAGIAIIDP